MAELLLELFSEEIPARLQARASEDLRRLMVDGLKARGLEVGEARAFATPRRLTLVIDDVPEMSPSLSEERKGPRVGAPEQAVQGFLKAAGLKSIEDAEVVKDEKKGDFYVARIEKPGRAAPEIVAEVLRETIVGLPWPKSMRFNRPVDDASELRWIRPLQSIVCLLGGEDRALRDRRHKGERHHERPPFSRSRSLRGEELRRLREGLEEPQGGPRRAPARQAHRGSRARARQGRQARACRGRGACFPRTPGSPSGRSCSWAHSTRPSSRCRRSASSPP